jgi:NAD(P)-dependent dehydrogenase (short-subunit alcohol dehydrogenase family)
MKIKGNTFIVTGGASGLGESTARHLFKEGANVAIFDMDEKHGKQIEAEFGNRALFVKVDVTNEDMVSRAVNAVVEKFGELRGVIQCAGIALAKRVISAKGAIHDAKSFNFILGVNVVGTFNVFRFAAAKMINNEPQDDERGVFIHVASVAAFEGQIGQAAYSASKGAIVAMTLPLAREFAANKIRVNTIAPGIFETPMMAGLPQKARDSLGQQVPHPSRMGKGEEFAGLAAHIISNPYLNGTVIRIDGSIRMAAM